MKSGYLRCTEEKLMSRSVMFTLPLYYEITLEYATLSSQLAWALRLQANLVILLSKLRILLL